jgi:hypothetical protein
LKSTSLGLIFFWTVAVFCTAQTAPVPPPPDASQSAQQPATPASSTSDSQAPASAQSATGQASAGQTGQPADKTQTQGKDATDATKSKSADSSGKSSGTSNDRLFFALPNFLTVDKNGNIIPLTSGQKFKVVARGAFDPVQIPWYGILSAIGQAENSEPGYGQGWGAYGKRWATYAADGTIENFFVGAILPSMFHQDPRFFPKPEGSFFSRAGYAASRIVVTRGDSGRREFNVSEVLGSALSATISTYSYHPHPGYHPETGVDVPYIASDRTIDNTLSVWLSQMGYDAITITLKEFWPDIRRKFKK